MVKPHWRDPLSEEEERLAGAEPQALLSSTVDYFRSVENLLSGQRHPRIRIGEREPLPTAVRVLVWQRDGRRCQSCGAEGPLRWFEIDHIVPWSAGGSDDPTNLRLLCRECNQERSNFIGPLDDHAGLPVVVECVSCMPNHRLPEVEDRRRAWCTTCRCGSVGAA